MSANQNRVETPALRLARYLKEFVGIRTTTVRDLVKYESVLWFGDMPQEGDCQSPAWLDSQSDAEDSAWLEVKKQNFEKAPDPPDVTLPWVQVEALKQATPKAPDLLASILLPDSKVEAAEGETPPLVTHSLRDHPQVKQAYDRYRPRWEAWSADHRRRTAIQKVYAELFSLHTQIRKQGELLEVVLGVGLLDWQASDTNRIGIRRHAIVVRVEIEFAPATGVIRVRAPGDGARIQIEDDMLEPQLRPDRSHYAAAQMQIEELGEDLWDKARTHAILKSWAGALDAHSEWFPDIRAQPGSAKHLVVSFAPALILRKRMQTGMVRIYDALIDQLSRDGSETPAGWQDLIDDSGESSNEPKPTEEPCHPHSPHGDPEQVYFPLPANREQRSIVNTISRNRGVLVQGPPGTGKSHTIANLVCHLLATGQRVLITAETARALQVLKHKLPKEIRPLCVSLMGQGGDAFAELNAAVQDITNRQASYMPGAYDARIADLDRKIDSARRQLAAVNTEIRSLRADETCTQSIANGAYLGTPSTIAARVTQERDQFSWLSLPRVAASVPPISADEVVEWLDILRSHSAEQIAATTLQVPPYAELPLPAAFAATVTHEEAARRLLENAASDVKHHPAHGQILALAVSQRELLRKSLLEIAHQRALLGLQDIDWRRSVLKDYLEGRGARWDAITEETKRAIDRIRGLLGRIQDQVVDVPAGIDLPKLKADAAAAISHLSSGGSWKRFIILTPKVLKGRTYLRETIRVNGATVATAPHLQILLDFLDLQNALADLRGIWSTVHSFNVETDRRIQLAVAEEQVVTLEQVRSCATACNRMTMWMALAAPPVPAPNWLDWEVQNWIASIDIAALTEQLRRAEQEVRSVATPLQRILSLHDAHPLVGQLFAQVETRNVSGYSEHHALLLALWGAREAQQKRKRVEEILRNTVPGLVESVHGSVHETPWDVRLGGWREAWSWALADAWLEKRTDLVYQQGLWQRRRALEDEILAFLGEAASLRAWAHFFGRLTPREAAALRSWREAVRAMGKGTGKSAKMSRLRQEARRYMDMCRGAIPVWIMPRYLVAEMVDPAPGRYDLVIVDEASQLGIESLFLFYIGKKLIVVGDDQQISPMGVGVADAAIEGLQKQYLDAIPHRHALSAQSSLYGNAKIRFAHNIVLREHFRCMPEIIQFSNDLCYAPFGTPLDPLRVYPANRLDPLVVRHVVDGYRVGAPEHAQNPPEADAVVAQIVACVQDPRYKGRTIGVISLQGEAQAKLIERKLLECLDPKIIDERRLICGDAYAFQGDERSIMFLSMVAAPGEVRIGALSTDSARQRFNVAVSRAQDQLWLFHTADLSVLSDKCMRYRLLNYMLDPARRPTEEAEQRFESEFEREAYRRITDRGFHVRTQVGVGDRTNHSYRIDLVVEGMQGRLAVECDGDHWHGPETHEADMARQRDLERAGWQFVRIRGGDFYRSQEQALKPLWAELERLGIQPGGIDKRAAEPPQPSRLDSRSSDAEDEGRVGAAYTDQDSEASTSCPDEDGVAQSGLPPGSPATQRAHTFSRLPPASPVGLSPGEEATLRESVPPVLRAPEQRSLPLQAQKVPVIADACATYRTFEGQAGPDPRLARSAQVAEGLRRIIDVEGPMLTKRAYDVYLRGCGIYRLGRDIKHALNKALNTAVRSGDVISEDERSKGGLLYSIVRSHGTPVVVVRERGPRDFEEIPLSELRLVAQRLALRAGCRVESEANLRSVLEFYDLQRLTKQVGQTMLQALTPSSPGSDGLGDVRT